mgnify:FL=1
MKGRLLCRLAAACIALACLCVSCAHGPEGVRPAQELYDEGMRLAAGGDADKAAEVFMQVRTYYPAHELARRALLATADAYFDKENFDAALRSYQEYRMLYPTDVEAGYSLFRIGMCHYRQMADADRDQSATTRAVASLESFLGAYPGSPYAEEAKKALAQARGRLAEHELAIGRFYLRKHNMSAACARFSSVRERYRDVVDVVELDRLAVLACSAGVPPARTVQEGQ